MTPNRRVPDTSLAVKRPDPWGNTGQPAGWSQARSQLKPTSCLMPRPSMDRSQGYRAMIAIGPPAKHGAELSQEASWARQHLEREDLTQVGWTEKPKNPIRLFAVSTTPRSKCSETG